VNISYDRVENGTDQVTIVENIPKATSTTAGVMAAADKTKLDELDWYFEE
jgi:hypothetical protein